MANIVDLSDALIQEGILAKKYEKLASEATKGDNRKAYEELREIIVKKMQLLHKQLVDND